MDGIMSQYKDVCSCVLCKPADQGGTSEDLLKEVRQESYNDIMAHEMAHASAAGGFGGGIVMEYDGNGIAVGGHVPISFPGMDSQNPETSLQGYQTIYKAALAPDDPSGQDKSLATRASGLMGQAQNMVTQKREFEKYGIKPGQGGFQLNPNGGSQAAQAAKTLGAQGGQPGGPRGSQTPKPGMNLSFQA